MKLTELANRYAKAAYELALDNRSQDKVFDDLRMLEQAFARDPEIQAFLNNPIVTTNERLAVIEKALAGKNIAKEAHELVLLLVRKDRFALFKDVVQGFQSQADAANNVCRGTVRSTVTLSPEERQRIEAQVEKVLKKKVIMAYKVDPSVIGGLVAQVGSYTFDDSLSSHLRRMNDELKRRTV